MSTWSELVPEIARAVGVAPGEVPSPGTDAFLGMIARLEDARPDLARRVTDALVGGDAPLPPTFAEMRREGTRQRARLSLFAPFLKRDPTQPPRRRINRTLILLLVGSGVTALLLALQFHQEPTRPRNARAPAARVAPRQAPSPAESQAPPQPAAPSLSPSTAAPPQPAQPPGTPPPPLPGLPPMPPATGGGAPQSGVTVMGGSPQGGEKAGTQVVVGDAATESAARTVIITAQLPAAGQAEAGTPPGTGGATQPGGATIIAPGGSTTTAGPAQAQGSSVTLPHLVVGDQFTVALSTPLAISTGWESPPAIAAATSGSIEGWKVIGRASLAQDGTPQIAWTQALSPDGKTTIQIHGIAYNPVNGVPGVAGARFAPMTPQAARTVLSGTLAAVGQYVQAQLQAQQTQVNGLTATITSQVPPFWQFVASQLATGFQPGPVQTGGTVLVSELPKGLVITVFITQTS